MRGSILFITSTWSCSMTCWFLSSCHTSNHNIFTNWGIVDKLYIVLFLHQTTTFADTAQIRSALYIVLFLHQTTTQMRRLLYQRSCISYYSYIKPQRLHWLSVLCIVVYRTIPTSNHNRKGSTKNFTLLYIVLFLHQTTTQENLRQWCE